MHGGQRTLLVAAVLLAFAGSARAAESDAGDGPLRTRDLGGISIVGDEEAPRSLYIVPWKPALPGRVEPAPFRRLGTDALEPVDPAEFGRRLEARAALEARIDPAAESP